jgi:hypothetical protein
MVTEEMRERVVRKIRRIVLASRLKPADIKLVCNDDTVLFLNSIEDIYYERMGNKLRQRISERLSVSYALLKYNSERVLEIRNGHIDSHDMRRIKDA